MGLNFRTIVEGLLEVYKPRLSVIPFSSLISAEALALNARHATIEIVQNGLLNFLINCAAATVYLHHQPGADSRFAFVFQLSA